MNYEPDRRTYQQAEYGNQNYGYAGAGLVPVAEAAPEVRAAFLNKVYMTMTAGVGLAMVTAYYFATAAFGSGAIQNFMRAMVSGKGFFLLLLAYIALSFGANAAARVKGLNVIVFALFTAFTGIVISPLFFAAIVTTHSIVIVWQAFAITAVTFGALTGYVLISGKDFSFMGGFLTVGLFVLIAFMIAGFFFNSWGFQMGMTCVGLLLFAGFVLYDTSLIMRYLAADQWVTGALRLFVDFINMFIRVLSILLNSRR